MVISFRSLHRQVVKAKGDLRLLSASKQITSSNCYSMERVFSSPPLPIILEQYGTNSPWLFLRAGYALLVPTEYKKLALSLRCICPNK